MQPAVDYSTPEMNILSESEWRCLEVEHLSRANSRLEAFRHPGTYHPVFDFLFEYYPVRPKHLRQWHPGIGAVLEGEAPHAQLRDYKRIDSGITLDVESWWHRRGESALVMRNLMHKTATNPATFDCFGLHEWAMVYKTDSPRHNLPIRLGKEGVIQVVESHKVKCSHYDAFRFFTEPAKPLNLTVLSRGLQAKNEQAGCVHATMDLFKWAWKLGPLVPGTVLLDCLDLAVKARILDMEASPYDCRELGFGIVAIETVEGKQEYVSRQRELAALAAPLRQQLVNVINTAAAQFSLAPQELERRGAVDGS